MPLLVFSAFLDYLFILIAILSGSSFAFLFYKLFILPSVLLRRLDTLPLQIGYEKSIVFQGRESVLKLSVGQLLGDFNLRLKGIREDHLVLKFRREIDIEEYEISCTAGGYVFFRQPHAEYFVRMLSSETFLSSEFIGHTACFRIVAKQLKSQPICYVDLELLAEYFVNEMQAEQMRFILRIVNIIPEIDETKSDKNGIYSFKENKDREKNDKEDEDSDEIKEEEEE